MEWLYHLGVPEDQIEDMAANSANTVPCMMPYIDAFFMPRAAGDRPDVVPEGAVNFAFIGQFAETKRDTIFTTEYSIRTGMEAVYTLLDIDRGVPEVWGSTFDVRDLLHATVALRDGRPLNDGSMGPVADAALKAAMLKIRGTEIEKLLKKYHVIEEAEKKPATDAIKDAVADGVRKAREGVEAAKEKLPKNEEEAKTLVEENKAALAAGAAVAVALGAAAHLFRKKK